MFDDFFLSGDTALIELCVSLLEMKYLLVNNGIDVDVQPCCAVKTGF
jgi:hypothetical protein